MSGNEPASLPHTPLKTSHSNRVLTRDNHAESRSAHTGSFIGDSQASGETRRNESYRPYFLRPTGSSEDSCATLVDTDIIALADLSSFEPRTKHKSDDMTGDRLLRVDDISEGSRTPLIHKLSASQSKQDEPLRKEDVWSESGYATASVAFFGPPSFRENPRPWSSISSWNDNDAHVWESLCEQEAQYGDVDSSYGLEPLRGVSDAEATRKEVDKNPPPISFYSDSSSISTAPELAETDMQRMLHVVSSSLKGFIEPSDSDDLVAALLHDYDDQDHTFSVCEEGKERRAIFDDSSALIMAYAKHRLLSSLMSDVYVEIDLSQRLGIRECPNSDGQSHQPRSNDIADPGHNNNAQKNNKRKPQERSDSQSGGEEESKRKRPNSKRKEQRQDQRSLACPFNKYDPLKYRPLSAMHCYQYQTCIRPVTRLK